MEKIKKTEMNFRVQFTPELPWQYTIGENGPHVEAHYRKARSLMGDLIDAVKICSKIEDIVSEAIEEQKPDIVSNICFDGFQNDVTSDTVYLIEDTEVKPRSYNQQYYYETLQQAIEHVIGEMPVREPIYKFSYVHNGMERTKYFDTFPELVEFFYENKVSEFNCSDLDDEEEKYLKQIQEYLVMLKLKEK